MQTSLTANTSQTLLTSQTLKTSLQYRGHFYITDITEITDTTVHKIHNLHHGNDGRDRTHVIKAIMEIIEITDNHGYRSDQINYEQRHKYHGRTIVQDMNQRNYGRRSFHVQYITCLTDTTLTHRL